MSATSPSDVNKYKTCPVCGNLAGLRVDGSIGRHRYRRNGNSVVCRVGDRGPRKTVAVVKVQDVGGQRRVVHNTRLSQLLTWISRQPGYQATARGDHFIVVGPPRAGRKPVCIPRAECGDQAWTHVLVALYRLGLVEVHRFKP